MTRLLILAVLAIAALFWARVVYGLVFRERGAAWGSVVGGAVRRGFRVSEPAVLTVQEAAGLLRVSHEAITWHLNGEHGISSEAIYDRLTYGATSASWFSNHPNDPSDFRRCEVLLRRVPDFRARFEGMAGESVVWAALVERWPEIVAVFEDECPGVFAWSDSIGSNRMAHRTYELMRSIIDKADRVSVST